LLANLLLFCVFCWEYEFFLECAIKYAPFDVMAIIVIVANCLLQNLK